MRRRTLETYLRLTPIPCVGSLLLVLLGLGGCVSYQPMPQDPLAILRDLEAVTHPASAAERTKASDGITALQAAAWAVTHNPSLRALRTETGVAAAELVQAGLLPDPAVGWDGMDAIAQKLSGQTPKTADYLSGLGLAWRVPWPGEISAKVGKAKARQEEVRQSILAGEWILVREVHTVFLTILATRARLDLNGRVMEIARRTASFFKKAREAKAATAIQDNLAATELATLQQDRIRLEGQMIRAQQALNALLGLPPQTELPLKLPNDPFLGRADVVDASEQVERAVRQRPDLKALLARYEAVEQELRLEIARQWPELFIGTGISLLLPIFSGFNAPAIRTAMARRERLASEVRAAVHTLRAEVHDAVTALHNQAREVRSFEEVLLPRLQESIRLVDEAFRLRRVTLVEILTAQRQVLDAQRNYLDARIERTRARLMVDTVTGTVLIESAETTRDLPAREKEKRR